MKKILLPILILTIISTSSISLNAGFLKTLSNLISPKEKEETTYHEKYYDYNPKEQFIYSQKKQEEQIQFYIETNDAYELNNFLNKIDTKTKKILLSKQITVLSTENKPFEMDFLTIAVNFDHCEAAEILIKHGANPNIPSNTNGFTPLNLAVDINSSQMVEMLINFGADINIVGKDELSPLNRAIYWKLPQIVKLLVKLGADINLSSENIFSSLNLAVAWNLPQMVKLLVNLGADINLIGKDGYSPLTRAADQNLKNIIKLLADLGVDINAYDENEKTALDVAIKNSFTDVIYLLVDLGVDVNLVGKDVTTPLNTAIQWKQPQIAGLLIKLGADINLKDKDGVTPLNTAIYFKELQAVKLLIELGANTNLASKDGFSPLNRAVTQNFHNIVKLLVNGGANINLAGIDGFSPLTRAVSMDLPDIIKLLINLGADVNAYDENGNTALGIAIRNSLTDVISLLIDLGADTNLTNKDSEELPIHAALKKENQLAAEKLLTSGTDINAQDYDGNTALHIAIEKSFDKLALLFIKHGAKGDIKNKNGISPILLSASYKQKRILKLLLKKQDPSSSDYIKALNMNDTQALKMLLNFCKTNPFTDNKNNAVNLAFYAIALGSQEIVDICLANDKTFMNCTIDSHAPLHIAVMYGNNELARYFIDKYKADINDKDLYGLTPLHYAAMYGNDEMTNYLINKKCDINIKSTKELELYKAGSTPYDLAIQLGQSSIVSLLSKHKAKKNLYQSKIILLDQSNRLAMFIDLKTEKTKDKQKIISVKRAFATELKGIIKQKACPAIIIGQHLLHNALKMSCSLKDWLVVEIEWENISGYLIIPKQIIGNTNIDSRSLDSSLQKLGFDVSAIQHSYVDESDVQNKQINKKKINKKTFSKLIPSIIDALLMQRERFVYWGGHGNSGNNPSIGNLSNNDASKLLTILSQKNTKLVHVSSCYFGGKNFEAVNNFPKMTIISGATAEIITRGAFGTRPTNWTGFFNGLTSNKNYTNNYEFNQYLANQVLPFLTTCKPNITSFPHIKYPGNSSFTLLNIKNEAFLINQEVKACSIVVDNKQLLEIDINQTKEPTTIVGTIKIKNKIPLIISNNDKNIFEQIYIDAIKDISKDDFIYIIKKLTRPSKFDESTIENTFLIKELRFPVNISLNIKDDTKTTLPKILHNVLIQRGPGSKCDIFFSTDKKSNAKNSIYISYDKKINKWNSYIHLSSDEFGLYQELLADLS